MRLLMGITVLVASVCAPIHTHALDLSRFELDSIAAWGKFPRFVINTYRWGDRFFNGYDTAYVNPTGYRFNVKLRTDSWLDYNSFHFDNNRYQMAMVSYPSTSAGLWLTYMALSAGYDINVSQLLNLTHSRRERYYFQFNCMLFSAELFFQNSNALMRIRHFGPTGHQKHVNLMFDDFHSSKWGLETYYFFNHKHYSQAAAFSYGRIQHRSAGSFFAGLSFTGEKYTINFSGLPDEILDELPTSWANNIYRVHAHNYGFKLGYGHNWVVTKSIILGLSEAPTMGVRHGYINDATGVKNSFYGFNSLRGSFVWNRGPWFGGIVLEALTNLFTDREHIFISNNLSSEISLGYRFNLW